MLVRVLSSLQLFAGWKHPACRAPGLTVSRGACSPPSRTASGTEPDATGLRQQERALLASLHADPAPKHPAHIICVLPGGHLCPRLPPLSMDNNCCSSCYTFVCSHTAPPISARPSKRKVGCTLSFTCIMLHLN